MGDADGNARGVPYCPSQKMSKPYYKNTCGSNNKKFNHTETCKTPVF